MATRTATAAHALIELVEEDLSGDAAIEECDRQLDRWADPALHVLKVDLLRRHGRAEEAADLIQNRVTDESLPVEVRLSLCRWYVAHRAKQRRFKEAADLARVGLAIANDADLAWNLVSTLFEAVRSCRRETRSPATSPNR